MSHFPASDRLTIIAPSALLLRDSTPSDSNRRAAHDVTPLARPTR
ncbi:hypothetical protein ES705_31490 [subsurface metagenome]